MKLTNNYCLPKAMVEVIEGLYFDRTTADKMRVGVTSLINPPRIQILTARHWRELSGDVSDSLWLILGNAAHYILGKVGKKDRLVEQKFEEVVDGITIVAKPDIYDEEEKSISDYKITSTWSLIEAKREWIEQINCYCWILRKRGYVVDRAWINAILRDWRRGEIKRYDNYPPIPFQRIAIEVWSFEKQQKFVEERVRLYKSAISLDDSLLPICTDKERWKKETSYAVYKGINKTASRVLPTLSEAQLYIAATPVKDQKRYRIEMREGTDQRCQEYCSVKEHCSFYKEHYGKK